VINIPDEKYVAADLDSVFGATLATSALSQALRANTSLYGHLLIQILPKPHTE
jgi:hypothetical protein